MDTTSSAAMPARKRRAEASFVRARRPARMIACTTKTTMKIATGARPVRMFTSPVKCSAHASTA